MTDRVKNIIMTPRTEWLAIENETTTVTELYKNYVMILAAIPVVARFLGGFVFGYPMGPMGTLRIGFFSGIGFAIVHYVLTLAMVYVAALVVSYIAPNFGGVKDDLQALKLTAYSYTPAWVAGVFALLPGVRFLAILGLWSLFVFYVGAPRMMKVPEDKAGVFTLVVIVATIVLGLVLAAVAHAIVPGPGMGFM
jgi:hypothetical protein